MADPVLPNAPNPIREMSSRLGLEGLRILVDVTGNDRWRNVFYHQGKGYVPPDRLWNEFDKENYRGKAVLLADESKRRASAKINPNTFLRELTRSLSNIFGSAYFLKKAALDEIKRTLPAEVSQRYEASVSNWLSLIGADVDRIALEKILVYLYDKTSALDGLSILTPEVRAHLNFVSFKPNVTEDTKHPVNRGAIFFVPKHGKVEIINYENQEAIYRSYLEIASLFGLPRVNIIRPIQYLVLPSNWLRNMSYQMDDGKTIILSAVPTDLSQPPMVVSKVMYDHENAHYVLFELFGKHSAITELTEGIAEAVALIRGSNNPIPQNFATLDNQARQFLSQGSNVLVSATRLADPAMIRPYLKNYEFATLFLNVQYLFPGSWVNMIKKIYDNTSTGFANRQGKALVRNGKKEANIQNREVIHEALFQAMSVVPAHEKAAIFQQLRKDIRLAKIPLNDELLVKYLEALTFAAIK